VGFCEEPVTVDAVKLIPQLGGTMSIENGVIVACLSVAIFAIAYWFGDAFSWGFTTLADCIRVGFDSACYSEHSNVTAGGSGEPMWWPHD